MPRFIRVTKANHNKDRGFIAADAICAVFENQESHNTDIMTMDGFWYEVVDGVEKVYADVTGGDKEKASKAEKLITQEDKDNVSDKFHFSKHRRFMSPSAAEDVAQMNHEDDRTFRWGRNYCSKKGYGSKRIIRNSNFPSGEGEGHNGTRTKAEDFTPHEPDVL